MAFEAIFQNAGGFGLFQKYLLVLLTVPTVLTAMQYFLQAFISIAPPHRCWVDQCDNETTLFNEQWVNWSQPYHEGKPDTCRSFHLNDSSFCYISSHWSNTSEPCHRWKFDTSVYTSTTATQWQLICDREFLLPLSNTVNMAGGVLGGLVFGYIGDRFGRKIALISSLYLTAWAGIGCTLVSNVYVFMLLRLLVEAFEGAGFAIVYIIALEFVGIQSRVRMTQTIQIIYSFGEMSLAGFAFLFRDWKLLQIVTAAPGIVIFIYYWILPESVRWLLANKRQEEAEEVLNKMIKWNTKSEGGDLYVQDSLYRQEEIQASVLDSEEIDPFLRHQQRRVGTLDLFRTPRLRTRTLIVMICWFLNTAVYFGTTVNATHLGSNDFLTFFYMALVEIPAVILSSFTLDRIGRRFSVCFSFVFTGIACASVLLVTTCAPHLEWLLVFLAVLGKFGSTIGNSSIFLFSAELFPTVLRNNGLGVCGTVSSIGNTVAPYVVALNIYGLAWPYITFGIGCFLGAFLVFFLPETLGKELPETIEDTENFGRAERLRDVNEER